MFGQNETPRYVEEIERAAAEAMANIPGVSGFVVVIRDPDLGPDSAPSGAVAYLGQTDREAHLAGHVLEALVLSGRRRPEDLGAPVAELLSERLEAWTAHAADKVEELVAEAPERARALLVKHEVKDAGAVDAYIAQSADSVRMVAAAMIESLRGDLDKSLGLMADGAASLVWERANSVVCGGVEDD